MNTSSKKLIILSVFLVFLMLITIISIYKQKNNREKITNEIPTYLQLSQYGKKATELNEPNICNQVLIRLLWNDLEKFTQLYYKDYLDINPIISDYDTQVKNIVHEKGNYVITFIVNPYIGPHLYFAEDEVVLSISRDVKPILKEYSHIKILELPNHYKHHLKKPLIK
mgnify:CR=1 FL=1|jgi:hypothetical protein